MPSATIISIAGRGWRARIGAGPYDDFIQTDAAINRGNSGGPMFNMAGEVVGVNTAISSQTGGNIGIGFAIPSSLAGPIVTELRDKGRVTRGWLGDGIQPVGPDIAEATGMKDQKGALVASVAKQGPAAKSGFTPGDVITRAGQEPVNDPADVAKAVEQARNAKKDRVLLLRQREDSALFVPLPVG